MHRLFSAIYSKISLCQTSKLGCLSGRPACVTIAESLEVSHGLFSVVRSAESLGLGSTVDFKNISTIETWHCEAISNADGASSV